MNGGKDIKIGHDKRPVSVVPSDEQPLYNIQNGELLTDEFGNPLITKVDQFFLPDASSDRATSVVFPENPEDKYPIKTVTQVAISTATYGVDLDVGTLITPANKIRVLKKTGAVVAVGTTVKQNIPTSISLSTGGSGYSAASNVATTGGSGTGLTVNITVSGDAVNGVTINNAGFSYGVGDTITITGGNNNATFTVSSVVAIGVTFTDLNVCEIRTVNDNGGDDTPNETNNLYFPESDLAYIANVQVGDKVSGANISDGSIVLRKDYNRIKISGISNLGITTDKVTFLRSGTATYTADNVLKIAEEFKETSEVSTTLLGVNRAETQLSLFSNVSSYGLNNDEWESFSYNTGSSKSSWDRRPNKIYGNRYLARIEEETQESAIKLSAFPPSHSYPFGPNYTKLGLYNATLFQQYINFVRLGNLAYQLFTEKLSGYPASWSTKFLNPADVDYDESSGEIVYTKLPGKEQDFSYAFQKIDEWTDTWRAIGEGKSLLNPVTGAYLTFGDLSNLLAENGLTSIYDGSNTRPGYSTGYRRYAAIQSRRVFRYQPGRISGFTFGLRASTEPVSGIALEWGIANATDQYVFKIYAGQLSIVRRSTVPLSTQVLVRNGLDPAETTSIQINGTSYNTVQPQIPSGDPFDVNDGGGPIGADLSRALNFHTIEIPRDKFNGDPLNGNGPSGYTIRPENVTMWKIEFGWYGAIGARFYAYIPAGAGEARWVVIHTLVIENSLGQPCLQDSYFRFKYSLDIFNTANLKTPQFLYKYGASYYIDGGDEGTSQIYSVSSGLTPKQINTASETSLFGIRPKDVITSQITRPSGEEVTIPIQNRKLILPTKFNISTNTLTEVKVKTCRACRGFGHVFTPGVATTDTGRDMTIEFTGANLITAIGSEAYFTKNDVGAKLIAPSIFGAYITEVDEATEITGIQTGPPRYESAKVYGYGPGLDNYPSYNDVGGASARPIGGTLVKDYANSGITTTIATGVGATYPHLVRFSNYDVHFASSFPLTGAEIDIQFINPMNSDQSSLGGSGTHFADFMIGVTDKKPSINSGNPNLLDGWDSTVLPWTDYTNGGAGVVGVGKTSILPEREILFGEHTHSHVAMDEDGVETTEAWSGGSTYRVRMGQDVRIPTVSGTSGGNCSLIKIRVNNAVGLGTVNQEYLTGTLPSGITTTTTNPRYFLSVEGSFGGSVTDWLDGQVVYLNDDNSVNTTSNAKFADISPTSYMDGSTPKEYIEITDTVKSSKSGQSDSNINIVGRPVQLTTARQNTSNSPKSKLFKYDVYPLYLVGKLMDKAKINNISIKETTGTFQRTTAPILSVTNGSNGVIDLANDGSSNNTINDSTPPTNFVSIDRLSSATVDTQNEHIIRPSVTKDIFYIGENQTKEVDMTKVFGVDRNVITPDNNNIEVTFLTAKQLGSGSSKFVQSSLNFKEQ